MNSSLKHHGYSPEEITDVFCTHLHFDHAGGNTRLDGGKVVPTFPNATYWIQNENWELANSPSEKDQGSFMSDDWSVLVENNMIKFVDGKDMFLPGIGVHLTYGHTTGMMHPIIQDNSNTIIYMADLIPMAAHIPYPGSWLMIFILQSRFRKKKKFYQKLWKKDGLYFLNMIPFIRPVLYNLMENIFSLVNPLQSVNEVNQMEALFQKGLHAYKDKDYFSAHDHWEELWSDYYLEDRLFVQALIQMAVSFVHLENGNLKGAQSLMDKSLKKLKEYRGIQRGIKTDILVKKLEAIREHYNLIDNSGKFNWDMIPALI